MKYRSLDDRFRECPEKNCQSGRLLVFAVSRYFDTATNHPRMAIPGVGPVTVLTFRRAVDVPGRFAKSRMVGASVD